MSKSRDQVLNDIFGTEQAASWLSDGMSGLSKLNEHLQAQGVGHKSNGAPAQNESPTDYSSLIGSLIEHTIELSKSLDDVTAKLEAREKAASDAKTAHDEAVKALDERVKAVEGFIGRTPSGVRDGSGRKATDTEKQNIENQNRDGGQILGRSR